MAEDANQVEWLRPENWRGGWLQLYVAPNDQRVWVPKRNPAYGWTLNFAHRLSYAYLALLLLAPMSVLLLMLGLWLSR